MRSGISNADLNVAQTMLVSTDMKNISQKGKKQKESTRRPTIERQYLHFFTPLPSPVWQDEDDNFSLDQPSPYKYVQTETTYGIDITLCPKPNA
jgi:hypothetical protein